MKTKNLLLFALSVVPLFGFNTKDSDNFLTKSLFSYKAIKAKTASPANMPQDDCGEATYEEIDGLVIMEAENLDVAGTDWNIKTNFSGFTGAGYLSWDGNNSFNAPGNGLISTKIRINTAGVYRFRWRSRIGMGTNSTEHNDSWLRFPDADDFFAEKNGNRIFPNGSGQSPNPNGSSSNGWFKVYLSGSTNWTWSTQTSDNDAHQIFVEFNTAGIYTMEISGRSKDHLIDRITMSNNANDPLNLSNEETPCDNSTLGITDIGIDADEKSIRVFPNPSSDYLNIEMANAAVVYSLRIFDSKGNEVLKAQVAKHKMDISQLSSGIYFGITDTGTTFRFIKK